MESSKRCAKPQFIQLDQFQALTLSRGFSCLLPADLCPLLGRRPPRIHDCCYYCVWKMVVSGILLTTLVVLATPALISALPQDFSGLPQTSLDQSQTGGDQFEIEDDQSFMPDPERPQYEGPNTPPQTDEEADPTEDQATTTPFSPVTETDPATATLPTTAATADTTTSAATTTTDTTTSAATTTTTTTPIPTTTTATTTTSLRTVSSNLTPTTTATTSTDTTVQTTDVRNNTCRKSGVKYPIGITFEELMDKLGSVLLIDVRQPYELEETGMLPWSYNLPLPEIEEAMWLSEDEFRQQYGFPKPRPEDSNVVLTCRTGRRIVVAWNKLEPLGYCNIRLYYGSYKEWKQRNGPLVPFTKSRGRE